MPAKYASIDEYLDSLSPDRREAITALRKTISDNIQPGFQEGIGYNMPSWYVPKSIYPDGYHCDPKTPLFFTSIASQKNSINWYSNFAGDEGLRQWFIEEYKKTGVKLDMGVSCVRFKKPEHVPHDLIAKVLQETPMEKWIAYYESVIKK